MFYNRFVYWLSAALVSGTFAVLFFLEWRRPLRRQIEPKLTNTARNFAIASTAAVTVVLLESPAAYFLANFVEKNRFGLLKIFALPALLETVLAVILLDYTLYLWHVLTHKIPFLWRFHKIHHADLDLTASTAVRFHFGEIAVSVFWRAGQILLIGVSPQTILIWQTALLMSIFFHHSNLRLPKNFEFKLQKFIVTPRLHGIHHSDIQSVRDSNWSSGLTVWDFLHGTFRNDIPQDEITIGVKEFDKENKVTIGKMLLEPFTENRTRISTEKAD